MPTALTAPAGGRRGSRPDPRPEPTSPTTSPPTTSPIGLLSRSLDVAELLIGEVLEPTAAADADADQVKETTEVAMLLRQAARVGDRGLARRSRELAERLGPLARTPDQLRRVTFRPSGRPRWRWRTPA